MIIIELLIILLLPAGAIWLTSRIPFLKSIGAIPERKIINNTNAAYHGMAVTYKKKKLMLNSKGIRIRYDIGKLYLKSEIFTAGGYYDGLSTYIHEMCHSFGGDSSASFSQALTFAIELLMESPEEVVKGKCKWNQTFVNEFDTVNETYNS